MIEEENEEKPANVDEYSEVKECTYKGERYSVRDNGVILRHPKTKRKRPSDNEWTFGKEVEVLDSK